MAGKIGVDPKKYAEVQKSFSVVTKINRARQVVGQYKLHVTPTMVVNGRFAVEPGRSSTEVIFAKIDQLIVEAHAAVKSASMPAAAKEPLKKTVSPVAE